MKLTQRPWRSPPLGVLALASVVVLLPAACARQVLNHHRSGRRAAPIAALVPSEELGLLAADANGEPSDREQAKAIKDFAKEQEDDLEEGIESIQKTLKPWEEMGVRINQRDDWFAFIVAVATNGAVLLVCVLVFSSLRIRFRLVYQKNVWDNWGYSSPDQRSEIVDGWRTTEDVAHGEWATKNESGKCLPERLVGHYFDWFAASFSLSPEQVQASAGLDQAMLIQFANMGIKVFATIGIPMVFIMAPLHIFLGGNRAGLDYLSWQGFANVEDGSPLCWVHAFVVWFVVWVVESHIYEFQEKFVSWRAAWLETRPNLQSCTILVENIPLRCRSHIGVQRYFNQMFGDREVVKDVHILIPTEGLLKLIAVRDAAQQTLTRARFEQARQGGFVSRLSRMVQTSIKELEITYAAAHAEVVAERFRLRKQVARVESMCEHMVDNDEDEEAAGREREGASDTDKDSSSASSPAASADNEEALKLQAQEAAAARIQQVWRKRSSTFDESEKKPESDAGTLGFENIQLIKKFSTYAAYQENPREREIRKLYSSTGFVTFKTRYDAIMALRLVPYTADREEFVVSEAPDPADVHYSDLTKPTLHGKFWGAVGVMCILGIFVLFLPTIAFISSASNLNSLGKHSEVVRHFSEENPKIAGFWNGLAGALGLNLVLGFLPTILVLISQQCFKQKAFAWSQHSLQKLYFSFLLVFQLLVVSISYSLVGTVREFVKDPLSLFERLSVGMGQTTHFFMNIFVLQWATIGMEHTRYVQLIKYILWKKLRDTPLEALESSEPEDQDYYGIGARSARYTALFVVGLAFVSLCPLICVLAFVNFVIIRFVVGYQVVYAETRKTDLGGSFWVTSLKHCQVGLLIYISCMTGVLAERADSPYPAAIAAACSLYVLDTMLKFDGKFVWESLSHEKIIEAQRREERGLAKDVRKSTRDTYQQPELSSGDAEAVMAVCSRNRRSSAASTPTAGVHQAVTAAALAARDRRASAPPRQAEPEGPPGAAGEV